MQRRGRSEKGGGGGVAWRACGRASVWGEGVGGGRVCVAPGRVSWARRAARPAATPASATRLGPGRARPPPPPPAAAAAAAAPPAAVAPAAAACRPPPAPADGVREQPETPFLNEQSRAPDGMRPPLVEGSACASSLPWIVRQLVPHTAAQTGKQSEPRKGADLRVARLIVHVVHVPCREVLDGGRRRARLGRRRRQRARAAAGRSHRRRRRRRRWREGGGGCGRGGTARVGAARVQRTGRRSLRRARGGGTAQSSGVRVSLARRQSRRAAVCSI